MIRCRCLYTDRLRMPLAETQMATVLSNADPHGAVRVQVRMNWQTNKHANKLGACDDTRWRWQQRRKKQPWLCVYPGGRRPSPPWLPSW